MSDLTVALSVSGVDEAVERFDRLTQAIERSSQALRELGEGRHGGIVVKMVGDLIKVEIQPVAGGAYC